MLLSLSGVNTVFCNQWRCSLAENSQRIDTFMKGESLAQYRTVVIKTKVVDYVRSCVGRTDLLARGKTTGETARLLVDPYRRKMELRAEAEELEKNEKQRSKTNLTGKGLFSLYISFFSSFRWAGLGLSV